MRGFSAFSVKNANPAGDPFDFMCLKNLRIFHIEQFLMPEVGKIVLESQTADSGIGDYSISPSRSLS